MFCVNSQGVRQRMSPESSLSKGSQEQQSNCVSSWQFALIRDVVYKKAQPFDLKALLDFSEEALVNPLCTYTRQNRLQSGVCTALHCPSKFFSHLIQVFLWFLWQVWPSFQKTGRRPTNRSRQGSNKPERAAQHWSKQTLNWKWMNSYLM